MIATIRRAVVLNKGPTIDAADLRLPPGPVTRLPLAFREPRQAAFLAVAHPPPMRARHGRGGEAERDAMLEALRESAFNVTRAARALGVSRATFYRMLDRNRIELSPNFLVREPDGTGRRRPTKTRVRKPR